MPRNEQVQQVLDSITKTDLEYRTSMGHLMIALITAQGEQAKEIESLIREKNQILENIKALEAR